MAGTKAHIYTVHLVNVKPSKMIRKALDLILVGDCRTRCVGVRVRDQQLLIQGKNDKYSPLLNILVEILMR